MVLLRLGTLLPLLCLFATVSAQSLKGLLAEDQLRERSVLPYPPVREADVMYATHVDRVVDTREKINLPFRHPERGFFRLLETGLAAGSVRLYDPAYPDFTREMDPEQLRAHLYRRDTVAITDPETGKVEYKVISDDFDPDRVVRYRLREIVYFDRQTSTQRRRIIGIAPLIVEADELGTTIFEYPLGWIYWPNARRWFGRFPYYLDGTDQHLLSWDDALEMRWFSSTIVKTSNVTGARIQDNHSGRDALLRSRAAERALSNREHDVWSY